MNLGKMLDLQQISIIAWRQRGIPHKYWQTLIEKMPITLEILAEIDQEIRYPHDKKSKAQSF